tara:strand:- start:153 stop:704 length:552 start_codon:yes stop_codon:yes gene_type:complete
MIRHIICAGLGAFALAACSQSETDAGEGQVQELPDQSSGEAGDMTPAGIDVVEVASANDNLSTFLQAATSAGVAETLANADGITIFAPINEAFEELERLGDLQNDRERMATLLKRHAVPGAYASADIPEGETMLETLSGETLTVTSRDGQIMLEGPSGTTARIVEADIAGDNGVVHAINTVFD